MKIQLSKGNETHTIDDPTLATLLEANKECIIEMPGQSIYFSEPFCVSIKQGGTGDLSFVYPLLYERFYGNLVTVIRAGELEKNSKLLSAITLCYALTKGQSAEIAKYFRGVGSSSAVIEYSFFSLYKDETNDYTKATIFAYLVSINKTALALENKILFENKEFSIDFILDIMEKKEELDGILHAR